MIYGFLLFLRQIASYVSFVRSQFVKNARYITLSATVLGQPKTICMSIARLMEDYWLDVWFYQKRRVQMRITASARTDSVGRELIMGLSVGSGIRPEPSGELQKLKSDPEPKSYITVDRIDRFFDDEFLSMYPQYEKFSLLAMVAHDHGVNWATSAKIARGTDNHILHLVTDSLHITAVKNSYHVRKLKAGDKNEQTV